MSAVKRQMRLQAKSAEQQGAAAEQEGDWQAGAPTDFQPFEASSPENTSGHHINVVLKPGASQVLHPPCMCVLLMCRHIPTCRLGFPCADIHLHGQLQGCLAPEYSSGQLLCDGTCI